MWNTTDFEEGGFLSGAQTETPNKTSKARRLQQTVPVVVAQIQDCEDEEFTLFGLQASVLCLVGIVKDYEALSTKTTFTISDHSGTLKAVWWLETDRNHQPKLPGIKENSYYQIFGSLRVQEGEKMIMVLKMFPIDDCNGPAMAVKRNNPGADLANSMHFMDSTTNEAGLNKIQAKVHDFLKSSADTSISGISKSEIFRHFPSFKPAQILEALEFLVNEGHAYTTLDSEHFKSTDSI